MNFLLVVVNCLFLKIPYFKHFGPDTLCNFLNEKCSDRIEERVLNTSVRVLIFFFKLLKLLTISVLMFLYL